VVRPGETHVGHPLVLGDRPLTRLPDVAILVCARALDIRNGSHDDWTNANSKDRFLHALVGRQVELVTRLDVEGGVAGVDVADDGVHARQ